MDALLLAVLAAVPNLAGFVVLSWSNNRTINRLFDQLQTMIKTSTSSTLERVIKVEAKYEVLANLIKDLLAAFKSYPVPMGDVTKELSEHLFEAAPEGAKTILP